MGLRTEWQMCYNSPRFRQRKGGYELKNKQQEVSYRYIHTREL